MCRFRSSCIEIDAIAPDRERYRPPMLGANPGAAFIVTDCPAIEANAGTALYWADGTKAGKVRARARLSSPHVRGIAKKKLECPTAQGARTCFHLGPIVDPLCADTRGLVVIKNPPEP
jgi:hypothetical protein